MGRARRALLLLSGLLAAAEAYPFLFVSRVATTCASHPVTSHMGGRGGGHLKPLPDPGAKFLVSINGRPAAKLCPGAQHLVRVVLPTSRYGLLSSSAGEFAEGDPWDCPNRVVLDKARQKVHNSTLTLACDERSRSTLLRLTTTESVGEHFLQANATFAIDPACATAKCKAQKARESAKTG